MKRRRKVWYVMMMGCAVIDRRSREEEGRAMGDESLEVKDE